MNMIIMSILTLSSLTLILTILIMMISKKSVTNLQKLSSFECGFNSMSMKRMPFSIHFFLIAVIFLVFDIEIIIIMPMILTMKYSMMIYWLLTTTLFIIIILIGLYHEWYNGMLNWTK